MVSFQLVHGYPECKNAKPIIETIDVPCPICGGVVQVKKTKKKRNYYICENNKGENEGCEYISWNKPKVGEKYVKGEKVEVEKKKKATKRKVTIKKKNTVKKKK